MWLGDQESDDVTVKLVTQLMEHQVDFDHIDSMDWPRLHPRRRRIEKLQRPDLSGRDRPDLHRDYKSHAGAPARFRGRLAAKCFRRPHTDDGGGQEFPESRSGPPDLSFATLEPTPEITDRVIAALPPPDVKLDFASPPIKYLHLTLDGRGSLFLLQRIRASPHAHRDAGRQWPGGSMGRCQRDDQPSGRGQGESGQRDPAAETRRSRSPLHRVEKVKLREKLTKRCL